MSAALRLVEGGGDAPPMNRRRLARRLAEARGRARHLLRWLDLLMQDAGAEGQESLTSLRTSLMGFLSAVDRGAFELVVDPGVPMERRRAFGDLLKVRRLTAGLTRIELGKRAHVSDATIKFIETAKHPPSRGTLLRLLQVSELRLDVHDVEPLLGSEPLLPVPDPERAVVPSPGERTQWWQLLGVDAAASSAEIEAAFAALARCRAPDPLRAAQQACQLLAARQAGLEAVRERSG